MRLLQVFMRACEDPDAEALDAFATGVRIGAGLRMPRTPAVYREKVRWRLPSLDDPDEWGAVWRDNYASADENKQQLQKEIDKEISAGRIVQMPAGEARRKWGERLAIASLALIQEGPDKFRLVHDGTNGVGINNRIRCRDASDSPMVTDIKAVGFTGFGLLEKGTSARKVDGNDLFGAWLHPNRSPPDAKQI